MNRWQACLVAAKAIVAAGFVHPGAAAPFSEPPVPCKWSAAYAYKAERVKPDDPAQARIFEIRSASRPRPELKRVYETAEARREVIEWQGAGSTEHWIVGNYEIYTKGNFRDGKAVGVPFESPEGAAARRSAFPELSWVRAELRRGEEARRGARAELYVLPGPDEATPPRARAWIDAKTGLPIAMEDAEKTIVYEFSKSAPSSGEMRMPPAIAETWRRMKLAGEVE